MCAMYNACNKRDLGNTCDARGVCVCLCVCDVDHVYAVSSHDKSAGGVAAHPIVAHLSSHLSMCGYNVCVCVLKDISSLPRTAD